MSAAAISARPGSRRAATSRSPKILLGRCNYDGYFLEYDTERAGGFEPLRFLPKGNKIVVLGLITSKSGTLEKKDDVKRRIDEATKYAALDQLCLSPQCGFASTEEGNVLTEERAMGQAARDRRARRRGLELTISARESLISEGPNPAARP